MAREFRTDPAMNRHWFLLLALGSLGCLGGAGYYGASLSGGTVFALGFASLGLAYQASRHVLEAFLERPRLRLDDAGLELRALGSQTVRRLAWEDVERLDLVEGEGPRGLTVIRLEGRRHPATLGLVRRLLGWLSRSSRSETLSLEAVVGDPTLLLPGVNAWLEAYHRGLAAAAEALPEVRPALPGPAGEASEEKKKVPARDGGGEESAFGLLEYLDDQDDASA